MAPKLRRPTAGVATAVVALAIAAGAVWWSQSRNVRPPEAETGPSAEGPREAGAERQGQVGSPLDPDQGGGAPQSPEQAVVSGPDPADEIDAWLVDVSDKMIDELLRGKKTDGVIPPSRPPPPKPILPTRESLMSEIEKMREPGWGGHVRMLRMVDKADEQEKQLVREVLLEAYRSGAEGRLRVRLLTCLSMLGDLAVDDFIAIYEGPREEYFARVQAAEALGRLGAGRAVPVLMRVIRRIPEARETEFGARCEYGRTLLAESILALGDMRAPEASVALDQLWRGPPLRSSAASILPAMGNSGDDRFLELLQETYRSESQWRWAAFEGLVAYGGRHRKDPSKLVSIRAFYREGLRDHDRRIRMAALSVLSRLGTENDLPRMRELLNDPYHYPPQPGSAPDAEPYYPVRETAGESIQSLETRLRIRRERAERAGG